MKNFICIIICILLLQGCDGPFKNCDTYYFSEEYISHVCFNPGTYWVYRDTALNITDSVRLLNQEIELFTYCNYNTLPEEKLFQHFYSSYFQDTNSHFVIMGSAFNRDYNYNSAYPMGYYRDNGEIIDSMLINDVWYTDVRVFKNGKYESYWAKHIGLIKKILPYPHNSDTILNFELFRCGVH